MLQPPSTSSIEMVTVIGIGSLLSEKSSRLSFPNLKSFRLGRVPNFRRIFGHPAAFFLDIGIGNLETLELSSLSAEYCEGSPGFVCSLFEVPKFSSAGAGTEDGLFDRQTGEITERFREREEEFDIRTEVVFHEWYESNVDAQLMSGRGILCCRSTDDAYVTRWGYDRFHQKYISQGIHSIWGWEETSGLKPCLLYLRHCLLSSQKMGDECYNSFLDDTYLVDRVTTLRQYLIEENRLHNVLSVSVPSHLKERYGG